MDAQAMTDALSAVLDDPQFSYLWDGITEMAQPEGEYAGGGVVQGILSSKDDGPGRVIVHAEVGLEVDLGEAGNDVSGYEVVFRVHSTNFPPEVNDLELLPLG